MRSEGITINVIDQLKYIGGKGVKASFFPVAGFLNDVVLSTSLKYAQQQGHIVGFRGSDPDTGSLDNPAYA